jgi:hypothetical protein
MPQAGTDGWVAEWRDGRYYYTLDGAQVTRPAGPDAMLFSPLFDDGGGEWVESMETYSSEVDWRKFQPVGGASDTWLAYDPLGATSVNLPPELNGSFLVRARSPDGSCRLVSARVAGGRLRFRTELRLGTEMVIGQRFSGAQDRPFVILRNGTRALISARGVVSVDGVPVSIATNVSVGGLGFVSGEEPPYGALQTAYVRRSYVDERRAEEKVVRLLEVPEVPKQVPPGPGRRVIVTEDD